MRIPTIGLLLVLSFAAGARELPPYVAADPSATPVTAESLLESDRFWPFRVALVEDWTPPGADRPLPRQPGVLIRVNEGDTLRVDYGRHGRFDVPIAKTDVVARAERVRTGETEKMAPNLVLTIGNKLLDTAGDEVRNHQITWVDPYDAFLAVFADVEGERFEALAASLRPLAARERLATVVFPQSEQKDSAVRRRLRALDWKVPFVLRRFALPYRRSLLGADATLPHVLLLSPDGRVFYRSAAAPGLAEAIEAALAQRVHQARE